MDVQIVWGFQECLNPISSSIWNSKLIEAALRAKKLEICLPLILKKKLKMVQSTNGSLTWATCSITMNFKKIFPATVKPSSRRVGTAGKKKTDFEIRSLCWVGCRNLSFCLNQLENACCWSSDPCSVALVLLCVGYFGFKFCWVIFISVSPMHKLRSFNTSEKDETLNHIIIPLLSYMLFSYFSIDLYLEKEQQDSIKHCEKYYTELNNAIELALKQNFWRRDEDEEAIIALLALGYLGMPLLFNMHLPHSQYRKKTSEEKAEKLIQAMRDGEGDLRTRVRFTRVRMEEEMRLGSVSTRKNVTDIEFDASFLRIDLRIYKVLSPPNKLTKKPNLLSQDDD
ncbi:hypothetical protein VP01_967g3 [Puccinia sorghi]|uniref:Uncharacterized protein n=1 Tax=Puccinia sorghi TaxID=27349 RepID=A0A0L6U853_9BASI|nr:hypothetical protein VP01_967g3 [Puccinia sorghi]